MRASTSCADRRCEAQAGGRGVPGAHHGGRRRAGSIGVHPTLRLTRPLSRIRMESGPPFLPGPLNARRYASEASVAGGMKRHAALDDCAVLLELVHRPVQPGRVDPQLFGDLGHGDAGMLLDQTQDILLSPRGAV